MEKITTRVQLEALCEEISNQWFWHVDYYGLSDRKLQHIIREANTLNVDYNERELKEKFNGDYEVFTTEMATHFGGFTKEHKQLEIAHKLRPTLKKNAKGDRKGRVWVRKSKSLIINAHYNYYQLNELFKLMWYTGDEIQYRSDYRTLPEKTEGNTTTILSGGKIERGSYGKHRKVFWEVYKNGNCKLTGDIDEFNALYTKTREENIEKFNTPEYWNAYAIED